ncbi:DUF2735 domain-containing protein [Fulvimarina sp. 2208YS6-2-32]|uniref:DUF2735 domain-containing protein n=1 Tax=Fulvimarina uroteuthidis TaxID=3098149 RepID=A0ABU5I4S0_9HYPH|nr:DUF2735 domain-containing protein [Fulvimarina sp. 2208YS6-2-32]MDY8110369.1 DUF2735 domain-containing protein [Fulvimarina sp. 2208YS6-2-32]
MATGTHTRAGTSATIFQFPVGGRAGTVVPLDTRDALRGMMSQTTARNLDWRAFYHAEAIEDERKGS